MLLLHTWSSLPFTLLCLIKNPRRAESQMNTFVLVFVEILSFQTLFINRMPQLGQPLALMMCILTLELIVWGRCSFSLILARSSLLGETFLTARLTFWTIYQNQQGLKTSDLARKKRLPTMSSGLMQCLWLPTHIST